MGIHIRQTRTIAVAGVLALSGASVLAAQDTTAATRQDTSGYQQSGNQTDTMQAGGARSDTSGYKSNGAATDTALKAKPGVQTGPAAGDSGRMGGGQDTSSYKSSGQDTSSYKSSTGQDTSSYKSSGNQTDTSQAGQVNRTSKSGYKYHGAATDTALKAKPGVQTGPTAGDSGQMHHRRHRMRMSAMDTVVCKDGSNSANSGNSVCGSHGGVDTAATWAAMKARGGWHSKSGKASSDSSSGKSSSDTSSNKSSSDTSSSSSTRSSP